jgi:formylglycine-generating enzyme required for sulfatase activity
MMGPGPDAEDIDGMGRETLHQVTLTKPFYIGVFRVSQKQWFKVMGGSPSSYGIYGSAGFWLEGDEYDAYSIAGVSYKWIRGSQTWPIRTIGEDCFLYRLRKKTGINNFDLPSEAQWEYACRAGTTTEDIYGFPNPGGNDYVLPHGLNADRYKFADVGNWLPNAWGLYGFLKGYYVEIVGDKWTWNLGTDPVIDPVGAMVGGDPFVVKGVRSRPPHSRQQVGVYDASMDSPISFRLAVHLD